MKEFYSYLYQYGLHDCKANALSFVNGDFIFDFPFGVYALDQSGHEKEVTQRCKLIVSLKEIYKDDFFNHISISCQKKKKAIDISFERTVQLIQKFGFDIDINFYAPFCNTILLKGYIGKSMCEIEISEVEKIEFIFED